MCFLFALLIHPQPVQQAFGCLHGIPSFCSEHSPAWPVSMSLKDLNQIEDPLYSGERQQWLYSLVGSQFTEHEMASGIAYRYINGENV